MREIKENYLLTDDLIELHIFDKAQFIWYSEPGSMGSSGEVAIVTDEGEIVHGSYIEGDFSFKLLIKKFPYLSDKGLDYWINNGKSADNEIRYFYLEGGTHLLMRENVYEFFIDLNGNEENYVQGDWLEMAERICPDQRRTDKLNEVKQLCEQFDMKIPDIYPFGTEEELDDFIACWKEYDPYSELK